MALEQNLPLLFRLEKKKDNAIASKIIKQGVSSNLYIHIIREKNSQRC